MELTNSTNVLEALVSNNRSELGKTFGVGMFVAAKLRKECNLLELSVG